MKLERRYSRHPLKVVTRDDNKTRVLTGYIAVFDSDSVDMGGYKERIRAGAFGDALKKNDVVALVNHNHDHIVGRQSVGTLRLDEDGTGLRFEIDLPETHIAQDLVALVERGDLQGCSFGFALDPKDETWTQEDGEDVATLERIDLYEVSVGVTFPAYPETSMSLRSRQRQQRRRERAKAKLKFMTLTGK